VQVIFADRAATAVWVGLVVTGIAVGWATLQPWWFIGIASAAYVAAYTLATARKRRDG
jgi:Flp pilus assembly protein TadB